MYPSCALCRYGVKSRGSVVCMYYGADRPRYCTRFVPREPMLVRVY